MSQIVTELQNEIWKSGKLPPETPRVGDMQRCGPQWDHIHRTFLEAQTCQCSNRRQKIVMGLIFHFKQLLLWRYTEP